MITPEAIKLRGMLGLSPETTDNDVAAAVSMLFSRIQESERRVLLLEQTLGIISKSCSQRVPVSLEAGRDNNRWHDWLIKQIESVCIPS